MSYRDRVEVEVTVSRGQQASTVRVVAFQPRHAAAFRSLNLEWIETYFAVEDLDRIHLEHPQENFIETGGAVFMAELDDGSAVGCCGLLKHGQDVFEVSKMAVAREYQGAGVGQMLLRVLIEYVRDLGAHRLEIISSTRLEAAIHLYKKLGFREVPLESDAYARGNIALSLDLSPPIA